MELGAIASLICTLVRTRAIALHNSLLKGAIALILDTYQIKCDR
ncbi:hypothetical protein [Dendronalium sp. ChiSLP03b]|nr:hypothetical protein [Dendronalium sp. ChiSLP03b]MDZ8207681.1 hypothetical protein [Dendronalium sp. ChiSLP03b]